jgi:hypothetical protein
LHPARRAYEAPLGTGRPAPRGPTGGPVGPRRPLHQ